MHALRAGGVEATTPERDVIVNLANEPNLMLGGASIHFEGYAIRVPDEHFAEAREILFAFRRRHDVRPADEDSDRESDDGLDRAGKRFLACSAWSIVLPLVMNVAAVYWLFRSRNVFQRRPLMAALAVVLNLFMFAAGGATVVKSLIFF